MPESTIPETALRNAISRNGRFALQGQLTGQSFYETISERARAATNGQIVLRKLFTAGRQTIPGATTSQGATVNGRTTNQGTVVPSTAGRHSTLITLGPVLQHGAPSTASLSLGVGRASEATRHPTASTSY